MDSNKIEDLLTRYWECETSLEEENQLHEYFSQPDVPEQFREAAVLFAYFGEQRKQQVKDPSFDRTVVEVVQKTTPKKSKVIRMVYNFSRIAAGLLVVVVATYYIRTEVRKTTPQEMVDTYSDPKLAFEETKKALMMISKSFGRAEEEARKINLLNEAKEDIQKESDTQEL